MTPVSTAYSADTPDRATRRIEGVAWIAIGAATFAHLWVYRFEMVNLDGISYLEIARAWAGGRWADAINGYWSPMYSWVLAAALALVHPSPYWEYPLVHAVNGVILLAACGAFAYFLRAAAPTSRDAADGMPPQVWLAFAYALFGWAAVQVMVVWMESPDLLAGVFVFLATGALVRISRGDERRRVFALFGVALAAGYLTRAAMLPISIFFFIAAAAAAPRRAARGLTLAAVTWLIVAGPWIAALSTSKGRLTTGDAGRLNYVWFVNLSEDWPARWPPHWPHFAGEPQNGRPEHPARRLADDPAVYEFAAPIGGTYPMWYDPSWWYEGVHPHLDPIDQLRRIKISLSDLYEFFTIDRYKPSLFNPQPAIAAVFVTVVLALRTRRRRVLHLPPALVLPPLAAIGVYALVYLEPRYVGSFVTALWLLLAGALTARGDDSQRALVRAAGIGMTAVLVLAVAGATWIEAYPSVRRLLRGEADKEHVSWITAQRMEQAGLRPGDTIGLAGNAQAATRWAHLAGLRIVAEVPARDAWKMWEMWDRRAEAQARVIAGFRRAGARWVVLDQPSGDAPPGWLRIDGSPYVVFRLDRLPDLPDPAPRLLQPGRPPM